MTDTDHEREQLRRALGVFVDKTPPAPEWEDWDVGRTSELPQQPRLKGPMVALTAAIIVLVVVGSVGLLTRTTPTSTPGGLGEESVTVGDWYDAVLAEAAPNGPDATTLQGALGPEPEFDTSNLGKEQRLEPVAQDDNDAPWRLWIDPPIMTDLGTLVIAGRVQSSMVGIVPAAFDPHDPGARPLEDVVCQITVGPEIPQGTWGLGAGCSQRTDALEYGLVGSTLNTAAGLSDSVTFVVPPDTSIVSIDVAGTKMWQRPRSGIAFFVGNFDGLEMTYRVYAASGDVVLDGTHDFDYPESADVDT